MSRKLQRLEKYLWAQFGLDSCDSAPIMHAAEKAEKESKAREAALKAERQKNRRLKRTKKQEKLIVYDFTKR